MSVTESFLSFYDHLLNSSQHKKNVTLFLIPESLRTLIQQRVGDTDVVSDEEGRQFGGGYGGCNDAYSAFAFLAFLFALLNFIQNNGGRRRRSVSGDQETMLASALMYQVSPVF